MSTSFRDRLIGTWDLISYAAIATADSTDIVYPLGEHAVGRAIFSKDGYVSAYIQARDITPYSGGRYGGSRQDELADAARKSINYTGPFFLDEKPGTMKQRIEYDVQMSLPPNWKHTTEVRLLEMWEEDQEWYLSLGLEEPVTIGVERVVKVTTRRAKDNSGGSLRVKERL